MNVRRYARTMALMISFTIGLSFVSVAVETAADEIAEQVEVLQDVDLVDEAEAVYCYKYFAVRLVQATCYDLGSHTGFRVVGVATCGCSIYLRRVYGQWWGSGGHSTASLPSSWYDAGWRFVRLEIQYYH
jgi:hypothetical protein